MAMEIARSLSTGVRCDKADPQTPVGKTREKEGKEERKNGESSSGPGVPSL